MSTLQARLRQEAERRTLLVKSLSSGQLAILLTEAADALDAAVAKLAAIDAIAKALADGSRFHLPYALDDINRILHPVEPAVAVFRERDGRYLCLAANHGMNSYMVARNECWYCTHPEEGTDE